jgi:hypothetical protein
MMSVFQIIVLALRGISILMSDRVAHPRVVGPQEETVERSLFRRALTLFCVFLLLAAAVYAQQLATLNVNVTDSSGAGLPQARITLKNDATGVLRSASSDAAGLVVLPGLPAGDYELLVEAADFQVSRSVLTLSVGQVASVPVILHVNSARQQVVVRESTQGVDTQASEVSQVIERRKIADLPIAGRDFIDFVLLTPNTNVGRSTAVGAQSPFQETVLELSFAGLRETHSTFFGLDGMDYTTSISGVQRVSPSLDWVLEFRVTPGPITADKGQNLGSVINTVTKSGTNTMHGSAYEFFRNNQLDANNLLSAPGFNTLRFNQFGGNVGGPIREGKVFYFLGYEGQRRAESPLYSSFILHCTDGAGCLGPGTPSINQVKEMLGLQPENLGSILQIQNYDKLFGKLTSVLSNSSSLNIGYLFNDERNQHVPGAAPGQGLPSFYRDNPVRDQTVYGNWLRLFGNHWTGESILNFARRTFHLNPVGPGFEPAILVADLFDSGGIQGGVHSYSEQHFQASENLTYARGKHSLKFGGDFEPVWIGAETDFFTPGAGIFSPQSFFGVAPFNAAPFGPGTPVEFLFLQPRSYFGKQVPQRPIPFESGLFAGPAASSFADSTDLHFLHKVSSVYAQDQWTAKPSLTLSLGLRYDVDFFPSATDIRLNGKMHPTNYGNVQPRAGLAYSFRHGKGVVRAGFGLFTGPFDYSDIMVSWQGAAGFTYMNQPLLPEFSDPANSLVGLGPSGIVGVEGPLLARQAFAAFTHTGAYPTPSSLLQFPLGYAQRKFPNAYAEHANLEVENQVAKDLFISVGYEFLHGLKLPLYLSINGVPSGTLPSGVQAFTPADPNFGFSLLASPSGYSIYHAGTLSVRKAFAHHYSILGNYTYSKSIDLATDVQLTDSPMDYLRPQLDRALGDNDVRDRFVLALLGETPATWAPALRNFKLSMLNTLQSPRHYTIFAGFDVNGDGFPFSDRVGEIGRNTYQGDSSYTTDIRLQRVFSLGERLAAEASVEVFNLFNRANVNAIDTVYGAADFQGPVPRQFGDGVSSTANPTFGSPSYAAPAREIQLALRFNF